MTVNYASFGRRFVASFLDGLIINVVTLAVIMPLSLVFEGSLKEKDPMSMIISVCILSLAIIIPIGYNIYFIGSRGQTLGKMALNIKVIKTDNKPMDYTTAFLREILGKILSRIVLLLGYLWMLWDDKKQTWHDKIAGTIVIRV